MSKLIHAQLRRLFKVKLFWVIWAAVALIQTYLCVENRDLEDYFEWLLFNFTPYQCFISAGFCGLFIGTEHSDGAMRNKLIVGGTRAAVYGANLIVCALACVLFEATSYVIVCTLGPLLYGTLGDPLTPAFFILCSQLVNVAFVALFTALSMVNSNKAGGVIVAFAMAFALIFVTAQISDRLDEPEQLQNGPIVVTEDGVIMVDPSTRELYDNPLYVPEGPARDALQFFCDFLPAGQTVALANFYGRYYRVVPLISEHWHWPICSLLFALCVTGVGLAVYKRKDIK